MSGPNVAFIRPELSPLLPQYELIRDCIAGETTVKEKRELYLPKPEAADKSVENAERYKAYLKRAVFYNVARRTHSGMIGQIFQRPPVEKVPDFMKHVMDNATGSGVPFAQVAKKACGLVLAYSRAGMFVDYPTLPEGQTASKLDLDTGRIRPTVTIYSPMEIINWRVIEKGADEVLSLVVLCETYVHADDGFEIKNAGQFRILKLDENGEYVQELWREPTPATISEGQRPGRGNWMVAETLRPKGPDGSPLKEIPFRFIGSENNDANPDNPIFYDLCSLNLAHYRNSADYEESCFMVGQPTPVVTGLTTEWLNKELKGKINVGSRGGIPLPKGADFKLVAATESTMLKEAMEAKERQMTALGAKLVEQKSVQRTAFESKVDAAREGSVLSTVATNVSQTCEWALKFCAMLMNKPTEDLKYQLNTDFDLSKMTPEDRKQTIAEWEAGAISWDEMRNRLRAAGTATEDDAKAKSDIERDQVVQMALTPPINQPGASAFGNRA